MYLNISNVIILFVSKHWKLCDARNAAHLEIMRGRATLRPQRQTGGPPVLDRMDYMMQALQAFPAFMAKGPQHRETGLALKFPRMTEAEKDERR